MNKHETTNDIAKALRLVARDIRDGLRPDPVAVEGLAERLLNAAEIERNAAYDAAVDEFERAERMEAARHV